MASRRVPRFARRSAARLFAVGLGLAAAAPLAAAGRPRGGFPLFTAGSLTLHGNRVQCTITVDAGICVDGSGSPVFGGGFWPAGTGDQYMYAAGIQFAGIVSGGPWAGDTVGDYFWDARGDQKVAAALGRIYDSGAPRDRLEWPGAAYADDPSLFAPTLLGRLAVSDQDTWFRFWDLDPNPLVNARRRSYLKSVGILVDQRTMSFSQPGLQDVVFIAYRFINITARDPAAYQGLAAVGYGPADIAEIARLGARYHELVRQSFGVTLPEGGYALDQVYVQFGQDPDIGQAGSNYSNANLVFATTMAWKSDFRENSWLFPLDVFQPPFAQAPGLVGVAFLRTPTSALLGVAPAFVSSYNTTGGAPYPDPVGSARLWRNMSANNLPNDGSCSVPNPKARHFCFFTQVPTDTRVFASDGGGQVLLPGASVPLVVAYVQAPVLQTPVGPYIGGNLVSGIPVDGARLVAGLDTLRVIDRAAGWVSHADANGNGAIEAGEVVTTPYSFYWKVQMARAALANGFLLPSAPEPPVFTPVPGDGRVTVVWQKSRTETDGDPFFAVASNPALPQYDPDYRRYDLEGYRVWRGTAPDNMQVVAQYDYAGTVFRDYTGQVLSSNQCAPELGVTATCPAFPADYGLWQPIVQVPPGGRFALPGGVVAVLRLDTAVIGGGSGRQPLRDTGVPFVYVDSTAQSGRTYFYAVTAFDVNSVKSGWSTMESPLIPRAATPRAGSGQTIAGSLGAVQLLAGDGAALDSGAALPTLDKNTGIFSGPMPPTDGAALVLQAFVPELAGSGKLTVTLDSIIPGSVNLNLRPATWYFTSRSSGAPVRFTVSLQADLSIPGNVTSSSTPFFAIPADSARVGVFGGAGAYGFYGLASVRSGGAWGLTMKGRADANFNPSGPHNGIRWWAGAANENTIDPNGLDCFAQMTSFTCVLADLSRNGGGIAGVDIFAIRSYQTVGTAAPARDMEGITSTVFRAADFKLYWGAAGAIDSVVDVTHRLRVPFSPKVRASWGVLNDSSFTGTSAANTLDGDNAKLTWTDIFCVDPIPAYLASANANACALGGPPAVPAFLMDHARLGSVAFASSTNAGAAALATNGTGFILYVAGTWTMFRMGALPAPGTVWNLRTYAGNITGLGGTYAFQPAVRPAAVPGLRFQLAYAGSQFDPKVTTDSSLQRIHTVPDPYYFANSLESAGQQILRFVGLPAQAIVRVYTSSGILVTLLTHNDPTGGGEERWDLTNRGGQRVASGVYFYHVETPDGRARIGRFTVVNRAP